MPAGSGAVPSYPREESKTSTERDDAAGQAELREKTHRVLDLERLQTRTNLKLIGSGLVIEALVRDRTLLVQHVLEAVVGRLDRIDSATSRHRVFDEIDGFLENVTGHIMGCIQQVMQDASAVNGVVRNMRRLLPGRADRNDLEDVTRLFGEVDTFKKNVEELATWWESGLRCAIDTRATASHPRGYALHLVPRNFHN
ncbi:hypothetical protein JX266_014296 [Neoarthrinium moseri]|uniref:uncharacterized protein n=1 Tax=Neoarthrinium moseri TaxID=1658444 RepID=UPI001FDD90B0|nr:uncharacterized protein JN550_013814 [Neoarthrinium moseri]KAI1839492.1 hypothetical protein JX266_014296 [Neoarthrinium moseri]KAI1856461.1 hypothetical protein JN550_013814 [Neoarthrinium moseri]